MKYFRFTCSLPPNSEALYNAAISEASLYCGYLARMYEFYFPKTKTGKVTALNVVLAGQVSAEGGKEMLSTTTVYSLVNWSMFSELPLDEKPLYLIGQCQEAIAALAAMAGWDLAPFEQTYQKIKESKGLFRDYFRKPVASPDKQHYAQVYFEDDYERSGTYIDFTDKNNNTVKRIQFAPSGYAVYAESIGTVNWVDDEHVVVYRIQVSKTGKEAASNQRYYWIVGIDGTVEFHDKQTEEDFPNAQALYSLGLLFFEGKIVLTDQRKGLFLIRKAGRLKYKHAQKWLQRYEDNNQLRIDL